MEKLFGSSFYLYFFKRKSWSFELWFTMYFTYKTKENIKTIRVDFVIQTKPSYVLDHAPTFPTCYALECSIVKGSILFSKQFRIYELLQKIIKRPYIIDLLYYNCYSKWSTLLTFFLFRFIYLKILYDKNLLLYYYLMLNNNNKYVLFQNEILR